MAALNNQSKSKSHLELFNTCNHNQIFYVLTVQLEIKALIARYQS